jgi:hypothetical protein
VGPLPAKTVNGLREAPRVSRATPQHTRPVLPLLKAEPSSVGQEHGWTIPLRDPALLVAVQSDQKSGVFATGIGYS